MRAPAHATLATHLLAQRTEWPSDASGALVELLRDDAKLIMPPGTTWFAGRSDIAAFLTGHVFGDMGTGRRLRPTAANRQPAFGRYWCGPGDPGLPAAPDPVPRRDRERPVVRSAGHRAPSRPLTRCPKAAAFSLSQSLRAQLVGPGVSVHAVLAGPMNTDMIRDWDIPKNSPRSVARAILDGVEAGEEEIFPDPMSATLARSWRDGAIKDLERRNAAAVQAMSIPA